MIRPLFTHFSFKKETVCFFFGVSHAPRAPLRADVQTTWVRQKPLVFKGNLHCIIWLPYISIDLLLLMQVTSSSQNASSTGRKRISHSKGGNNDTINSTRTHLECYLKQGVQVCKSFGIIFLYQMNSMEILVSKCHKRKKSLGQGIEPWSPA